MKSPENTAQQDVMTETPKIDENCRKNRRNPKVLIIDGPATDGKRGPWKFAQFGNTQVPIYKSKNRKSWLYEVRFFTPDGHPDKNCFSDPDDALNRAAQLALLPAPMASKLGAVAPHHLNVFLKAVDILDPIIKPLGISLDAGIEEYAGAKRMAGHQDLRKIVHDYCNEPWVVGRRTPVGVLAERFVAERKSTNHRPEYTDGLYYTLRRLTDAVGNIAIGDITKDQLEAVIKSGGKVARSHKTYQTNIRTFFRWCQVQEYLDPRRPSEAQKLTKIKVDAPTPEIYTVEEARRMLTETRDVPGLLLLSLGFFSGIRHAELQRIKWEAIQPGGVITVDPAVSKIRSKTRTIPISTVLQAWLEPFFGSTGMVLPHLLTRDKLSAHLRAAGSKWKRNGLRHSFASYRLAITGSYIKTADEDGHSPYILERHYKGRTTQQAAEEYFSLRPETCGHADWYERARAYLLENPPRQQPRTRKSKGPRPMTQAPKADVPDAPNASLNLVPMTADPSASEASRAAA